MSAKNSKSEDDINFQTYVSEVTDGKIRWNIFVNLMKDLSYSDIDRLKKLNATLLTELILSTKFHSDIFVYPYLKNLLLTQSIKLHVVFLIYLCLNNTSLSLN